MKLKTLCSTLGVGLLLASQLPVSSAAPAGTTVGSNISTSGIVSAQNIHNNNSGDTEFVFKPGGIPGGNVYTDFNDLYTDFQNIHGQKYIQFDGSIQSPVVVPAGNYNLDGAVFSSVGLGAGGATTVNLADGVVLQNWGGIQNNIHVHSLSTDPVYTITNGTTAGFGVLQGATLTTDSTAPIFKVENGGGLYNLFENGAGIQTGTSPVVQVNTGGTYLITLGNIAQVGNDTITGTGTFFALYGSSSAEVGNQSTFTGTRMDQLEPKASLVSYINTTSQLVATTIQAAIDELAASVAKLSHTESSLLDFGIVFQQQCNEETIVSQGAEPYDTVALGLPPFMEPGLVATAYVSSSDNVTVRVCNTGMSPALTAIDTYRVRVMK